MLVTTLLAFIALNAHGASVDAHVRCAEATGILNQKGNEIFQKNGFLFTMNRIQKGMKPHTVAGLPLPTFWVVVDGKIYVHHLKEAPLRENGNPDVFQRYRMEVEIPGRGLYCLDYRYRMATDKVEEMEKELCPEDSALADRISLGKISLQELTANEAQEGSLYMLQDLIEDNLLEAQFSLESALQRLRAAREQGSGNLARLERKLKEQMERVHQFDWQVCEPVAEASDHHSVKKRLDQLVKMYLAGAVETGAAADVPQECLPELN